MPSVLIIGGDVAICETFGLAFRSAGYTSFTALDADEGVALASRAKPDLALVDLHIGESGNGIDVIRSLRDVSPLTVTIVITGYATTRTVVRAMRLGAIDVLDKPVDIDDVLGLASRLMTNAGQQPGILSLPAFERWSGLVMKAVDADTDLATTAAWARCAAVSEGTLRPWCRAADLPPKRSLNLGRMLRVVCHRPSGRRAVELLDIVEDAEITILFAAPFRL